MNREFFDCIQCHDRLPLEMIASSADQDNICKDCYKDWAKENRSRIAIQKRLKSIWKFAATHHIPDSIVEQEMKYASENGWRCQ